MAISDLESFIQHITAIEPCYGSEGGNASRIYTSYGEIHNDRRRVQTILKRTADFYGGSLAALRRNYGCYLGSRQSTPLPLKANLVLVPIKMRFPLVENDSVTGFVNACSVIGIEPLQSAGETSSVKCMLQLSGGLAVPSYYSVSSTEKRLLMGRLALDRFCQLQGIRAKSSALLTRERSNLASCETYSAIGKLIYELINENERGFNQHDNNY